MRTEIIMDKREERSHILEELISLGINVEIRHLKIADYLIRGVAIERKTVSDFISSMVNRRLLNQIKELSQYPERLLLIEGIEEEELYSENFFRDSKENKELKGIHPNAIRGFILSILLNYKIPIVFTKDYKDTVKFMVVLLKKNPKEISLNVKKRTLNSKERIKFILEGFPGIGPKTSIKLLQRFKSLKKIITAPEEDLKKILGKKADHIIKLIGEEY